MRVHTARMLAGSNAVDRLKADYWRRNRIVVGRNWRPGEPDLLQTDFTGPVHGEYPAASSHGADRVHFYLRAHRREDRRHQLVSAALFLTMARGARSFGPAPALRLATC